MSEVPAVRHDLAVIESIDYMFGVVTESLTAYEARARSEVGDVGANVGVNVGVTDAVVLLLRADPTLSAAAIAERLGKTPRTIERHLAELKATGRVRREGPAKAGRWVITDR